MELQNVLLVVNPISGGTEKEAIISAISNKTKEKEIDLTIHKTDGKNDREKIKKLIEEKNPDRVLVVGGDGTVQLVVCEIPSTTPIGIIPAGSANGLAINFEIPDEREKQIEIALGNQIIEADILLVNKHVCLHISDLGINAELIKNYEASAVRGKIGYILQSIPTLLGSKGPFQFTIEAHNKTYEKEGILLAIANAQKFGTGANINPTGKINDGKFELLVFKKLDFIKIVETIRDKAPLDPDFVEVISTSEAKILAKRETPLQVDGEFIGETKEVTVSVHSEKVKIAVPEHFKM